MWQDILKYGIKNMKLKEIIEQLLFYTGEYEEACEIVECVTDEEVAYLLLKDGFMIKLSKDGFNCWSSLKSFSYHNIIIALGDTHLFDIMCHEEFVPGGDHSDDIIEFRELNLERYPDVAGYIKLK